MSNENTMAVNLIKQRGNRATASLLTYMENNVQEYIPDEVWNRTRREVLDAINGFKDLAIDVVKSDTAILNEEYLQALTDIKSELRNLNGITSRERQAR
jgi:sugar-specific transcriptional regulator TrmB